MLKNDEKWFQVSLRLTGDTLPVDEISEKLEIEYSNIGRKGEHIGNKLYWARYRPRSPAAESRSGAEERGEAQAVVSRVQRLVVWLLKPVPHCIRHSATTER